MYAVGSFATLAFLNTVLDDPNPIADFIPDSFDATALAESKQWISVSRQSMVDYFTQFAKSTETFDLMDMAVASVAIPTIYNKTIDTFAEDKKIQRQKNKESEKSL